MSRKLYEEVLAFSLSVRGQQVPAEVTDGSMPQSLVEMLYAQEMSAEALICAVKDTALSFLDLLYEDAQNMTQGELQEALQRYGQYSENPEPYAKTPGFTILAEYEKLMVLPGRYNRDKRTIMRQHAMGDVPLEVKAECRNDVSSAIKQSNTIIQNHPFYKMLDALKQHYTYKLKQEFNYFISSDVTLFVVALPYLCDELLYNRKRRITTRRALNIMEPTFALARMLKENKLSQGTTNDKG